MDDKEAMADEMIFARNGENCSSKIWPQSDDGVEYGSENDETIVVTNKQEITQHVSSTISSDQSYNTSENVDFLITEN